MSEQGLAAAVSKMKAAGVADAPIAVFSDYYRQLEAGATGLIPESSISPLLSVDDLAQVEPRPQEDREALATTALIKLNGGLGTSMGMEKAKSLLEVRGGLTFLDITVRQVLAARERHGVRLPLLFMNSFSTRADTLAALEQYPELEVAGLGVDFVQSKEVKLRASDLTPVEWPTNPDLEWCPPGHGDLYPSLLASGVLDRLIAAGFRYANVSNSDNLGAAPNERIAGWFARSGAPYAAEVCHRTQMDRKGGHLARRKSDGRVVLRDTAQTPPEDMHFFTDEHAHPFFHTNNLWFDLLALRARLTERGGIMGLPLIRNEKTVDPRDPASTPVIQIESAMGAAIEVFEGATALVVPRGRFLPVKTTNELLLLRSDVYDLDGAACLQLKKSPAPVVSLGGKYKKIGDFDARFPAGPPSLLSASAFTVEGDWTVEGGCAVVGDVTLQETGAPEVVPAGTRLTGGV